MTLSERDLTILSAYQTLGEEPIHVTARITQIKSHIVRRTILRASQEGFLTRRVFTNIFLLGLQQYTFILSFDAKSQEQLSQAKAALCSAPYTELVLDVDYSNECQFYILVTVEHISALEAFFQYIRDASCTDFRIIRMQARSGSYYFGTKSPHASESPAPIHITKTHRPLSLSPEELKVLEVFASSPNGVRTQMARTLGIPLMTLQYRIERLERLGVLPGVRYAIAAHALNYRGFRCFIEATVPLESQRHQLYEWAKEQPYVVAMMYGLGSWHYELRIESPDQAVAERLVSELVGTFGSFIHYSDLVPLGPVLKLSPHPDYRALEDHRNDQADGQGLGLTAN